MKQLRALLLASLCCAFLGVCLAGCSQDTSVKQDPGQGSKGLSPTEKKSKQGTE